MRVGLIYKLSCKENNNFIVGSTISFKDRKNDYRSRLRRNIYPNKYLQNTYNKYGWESFEFNILKDNITEDILENVEDVYIGALKGRIEDNKGGMNVRDAKRVRFSDETREKMSKSQKILAKTPTRKETIAKIAEGNKNNKYAKGHTISEESKNLWRNFINNYWTDENRKIHSDKIKRTNPGLRSEKPINQIDKNTGNILKVWKSLSQVERELGILTGNITACCKGRKRIAGGFKWEYNNP